MATLTERLAIVIEANASQAVAQFKQLGAATKGLSGDAGKAGGALANIGGTLGGLLKAAGPEAALAAGGVALAKFAADGVTSFVTLAGEVKEFRRVAGGTAEDASRLVAAFSAVGVDATTAATGVFQLEKHLASGADKLAAFGVTAIRNKAGNTDMQATLLSVGDAYKKIQDPVQRAALLTAAFGRQGTALIPLLGKSRAAIQAFFDEAAKHHAVLSDADLKKATDYKLAVHDLGETWKGLGREVGAEVVPVLTTVAKDVTDIIGLVDTAKKQAQDFLSSHKGFDPRDPFGGKASDLPNKGLLGQFIPDDWYKKLEDFGIIAADTTTKAKTLGPAFKEIGDAIAGVTPKVAEDAAAMDLLAKSIMGVVDADHSLADAHKSAADAKTDLDKLLKAGPVDKEKVGAAKVSGAEADRGVGAAQRDRDKAQGEYDQASAAAGILGTSAALAKKKDASDNLAGANDNLAAAQARAAAAHADLKKAEVGDPDYQTKIADARQKVADAELKESQQALASVQAHDAEKLAIGGKADELERLIRDYQTIIALHPETALALAPKLDVAEKGLAGVRPDVKPPGFIGPINVAAGQTRAAGPVPPTGSPTGPPVEKTVTNQVTINTTVGADARAIAREVIWNLS